VAASYGPRALACVLTGTGSDGTMGASAIKSRGGTVIVEDPEHAEFKGMPESVVASGSVDFVLPLGEICRRDLWIGGGQATMTKPEVENTEDQDLEDLLAFIRDSRGFDFTGYKRSSLGRRVRKRMTDVGMDDYVDYRDRLESSAEEFRHLFDTILINVTDFFRDADAWSFLQSDVVPELVASLDPSEEIRVWSAGCSSGEEAYSLAIIFAEILGAEAYLNRVKIYGTDVDEDALREARAGLYSSNALKGLPEDLRKNYFEPSGTQFAFRSDLRRRVIFGRHDITSDAPISRLNLLVCRNTMMYFNVETQSQIIERFHFALQEGSHLFLGKAEMLLSDGNRFEAVNMRQRIFRRRPGDVWTANHTASIKLSTMAATSMWGSTRNVRWAIWPSRKRRSRCCGSTSTASSPDSTASPARCSG